MNIKEFIGESTGYDKKLMLEISKPKSWLKTVSSFANGRGGKVIFGVSDDGELVGLKDYNTDSENISELIKTKMDPIPCINLEIVKDMNKYFLILEVEPGNETPYYVVGSGGGRTAYIRIGNESVPASSNDIRNLALRGMNKSFDSLSSHILIDKASFTKLKVEYYKRTKKEFRDTDFLSFGLADQENILTNAGALFADEHLLLQSRVFCTRWNGNDKANGKMEATDDNEFEGNLLELLKNTLNFVSLNTRKSWRKGEVYRIEYPEYPERAVQEAVVNSLIHRDYGIIGSEVHLDIFDNRMEITSPGGMYDGSLIQDKDLSNIISIRRNPIIADLFGRMDLMERRGSGLKKILESYEGEEHYYEDLAPKFMSTNSMFKVILNNMNYNVGQNVGQNVGLKLKPKERQEKTIGIIKKHPQITALELSEQLAVSERTIERDLKELTDKGKILYAGSSKLGKWIVKE